MVNNNRYEALKIEKEKAEDLARLKAQETAGAKIWNNDANTTGQGNPDEHT